MQISWRTRRVDAVGVNASYYFNISLIGRVDALGLNGALDFTN